MKIVTEIPLNVFTPELTSVPFSVVGPDVVVDFLLPRWSTHALHAPKQGITLFHTESLNISGSYLYFAEVREEENVEQLKLDFEVSCFNLNVTWFSDQKLASQCCLQSIWVVYSIFHGSEG